MKFKRVDQVVKWRLCLGCGACVSACPGGNIELRDFTCDGLRPVLRDEDCEYCGRCVDVCPGIELCDSSGGSFDAGGYDGEWGSVLEVWEGYAGDEEIRFKASSGGAVSALCWYMLDNGFAGAVAHTSVSDNDPIANNSVLSTSREGILSACGSRYSPAGPCELISKILECESAVVFAGKPCDIAAVKKFSRLEPELDDKIALTISIFCAGTPASAGTMEVLNQMGADIGNLRDFRYRGDGWPGYACASLADGETKKMSYEDSWGNILSKFVPLRCRLCPDSSGQFADISCGDPWYDKPDGKDPGRSLIIARTERGRQVIADAIEKGYIIAKKVDEEVISMSQRSLLFKKRNLWARLCAMRVLGVAVPVYRGFDLFKSWRRLCFKDKARSFAGTFKRILSRGWFLPAKPKR